MIKIVFLRQPGIVYPAHGAVLVELPDHWDGVHPLRDGTLLARIEDDRRLAEVLLDEDGPPVMVLADGETWTSVDGCGIAHADDDGFVAPDSYRLFFRTPGPELRRLGVDGRKLPEGYEARRHPLPYRHVEDRPAVFRFHPLDLQVSCCEACGAAGFLKRDFDHPDLAALCGACYTQRTGDELLCCEDWCHIEPEHSGLCAPE